MSEKDLKHVFPWEYTFRRKMSQLREAEGITQNEFAKRLKSKGLSFHQQTVQRIEAGERPVRLDEAHVIASTLGVSLEVMLTERTGPLEAADPAVYRARRVAQSLAENSQDDYLDLLNECDQLYLIFEEMRTQDTPGSLRELAWIAAWIIKCWRVIDAWLGLTKATQEIGNYDKSNVDIIGTLHAPLNEVAALSGDSKLWGPLSENERPLALSHLDPDVLWQWLSGRSDGER